MWFPDVLPSTDSDRAIMLTVFGTSTEAAVTFEELIPFVKKLFPERMIGVPYTSGIIREKLNALIEDPAAKILSPAQMLEKLKERGCTDIAVVSTLLFAGTEHDKLKATVDAFAAANPGIIVSYTPPLLADEASLRPVVATLGPYLLEDGLNVVVSHGTEDGHPVERTYLEIAELVAGMYPNARVGSIEGLPDLGAVLDWVEKEKEDRVRFLVFMFVAGDHAENDIASDDEESLFTAVRKMGKTPSVAWTDTSIGRQIASLGLDPAYRSILLDHYARNVGRKPEAGEGKG